MRAILVSLFLLPLLADHPELYYARDRQDRAALESRIATLRTATEKAASDASAHYRLALAHSLLSEVALELRDKNAARSAAEEGIRAAEKAVALSPGAAEYHRVLGTLCGQVIPANVLAGLKYGRCAMDSVKKAIELDQKSSAAWLSKGVGNYYLPASFGGGVELAIADIKKAIELAPKSADAHLWLGIALRKAGKNAEARQAIEQSLKLNPNRLWAKQQLEKTPAAQ